MKRVGTGTCAVTSRSLKKLRGISHTSGRVFLKQRARSRARTWLMALNFFKLREVTAQVPVPTRFIPRVTSAYASISFHNIWRWTNKEFASFDPENIGNRDNVNNLLSDFTDQLPPPTTATFSLKLTF